MLRRPEGATGMRKFFNVQSVFFNPMWRRAAICIWFGVWAVFEAANGQWVWAALFGAATAWLVHQFFVVWVPQDPDT